MEDIKGKKLVTIKILIDQENDEFGIDTYYQGFQKPTPILEQIMISGILDQVKKQVTSELIDAEIKGKQKDGKN